VEDADVRMLREPFMAMPWREGAFLGLEPACHMAVMQERENGLHFDSHDTYYSR